VKNKDNLSVLMMQSQSVIKPFIYHFYMDDIAAYHLLFACRHLICRPLLP